jgi:hypothetical protein
MGKLASAESTSRLSPSTYKPKILPINQLSPYPSLPFLESTIMYGSITETPGSGPQPAFPALVCLRLGLGGYTSIRTHCEKQTGLQLRV